MRGIICMTFVFLRLHWPWPVGSDTCAPKRVHFSFLFHHSTLSFSLQRNQGHTQWFVCHPNNHLLWKRRKLWILVFKLKLSSFWKMRKTMSLSPRRYSVPLVWKAWKWTDIRNDNAERVSETSLCGVAEIFHRKLCSAWPTAAALFSFYLPMWRYPRSFHWQVRPMVGLLSFNKLPRCLAQQENKKDSNVSRKTFLYIYLYTPS